ncbi:MAG: pentapeptide repeat-containing protein [Oscillospiraceae bacterium]|jgi:uncharacterized protein YjbI with pentapeptide repeats|nr:pentapeptide repeat-containing protein [Oscillospiraceae bacterium]
MRKPKTPPSFEPDIPDELMDAWDIPEADAPLEAMRWVGARLMMPMEAHLRGCVLERCTLIAPESARLDLTDCLLDGCDLAGARLPGSTFRRVRLNRCRGVGLSLPDARLHHVAFADCRMDYLNLGGAELHDARFTDCAMPQCACLDARFEAVRFARCHLQGAEFYGTALKGVDLRDSQIDGIGVRGAAELNGAVVTPLQACELAGLLGLVVRDGE